MLHTYIIDKKLKKIMYKLRFNQNTNETPRTAYNYSRVLKTAFNCTISCPNYPRTNRCKKDALSALKMNLNEYITLI